jgi:hypothetical protein
MTIVGRDLIGCVFQHRVIDIGDIAVETGVVVKHAPGNGATRLAEAQKAAEGRDGVGDMAGDLRA